MSYPRIFQPSAVSLKTSQLSKAVTRRFEFTLFYTTNGKMILKRILKKWGGGQEVDLSCSGQGQVEGFVTAVMNPVFYKKWRSSSMAEDLLAFQEGP